ncbi:Sulfide:quinone oxidoreductase, Type III [hydrothermal vent metagenome]|uniref:Sulfide:quinone oxidoreductase, Type III n=1 Tax=hydrothermal vent metagenome TaxID=652676 RepID=A0A3B1BTN5_9ZZZZ
MKKLLILGAGTGGTILANTLSRKLDLKQWDVTVIDKVVEHLYQPGFIFLPFRLYGYENRSDVTHPVKRHLPGGVNMVNADIRLIDHAGKKVETSAGVYSYDWLILALGCHVAPEEVEGLEESMGKNAFTFYTLEGSLALQKALEKMEKGKLTLNIAEMPIKCPVAPIEFIFLADYYFSKRGIRDKIEIEFVTPLAGAFTKPQASRALGEIARRKNIKITPNFDIQGVDHEKKVVNAFNGDSVEYDILASVPPNLGPQVIDESGLGDGAGYALTDEKTLKHKNVDNIYVLGDNTNVPTSKAGSVAHFEAEIVEENILREIDGKEPIAEFDGHSNCFIESGFHKALLIDFNYDTEPLPGTFPLPKVGPFSLLKESRLNHWGKMGFKQIYWNLLLSGHLPGDPLLPSNMSFTGKDISSLAPE